MPLFARISNPQSDYIMRLSLGSRPEHMTSIDNILIFQKV